MTPFLPTTTPPELPQKPLTILKHLTRANLSPPKLHVSWFRQCNDNLNRTGPGQGAERARVAVIIPISLLRGRARTAGSPDGGRHRNETEGSCIQLQLKRGWMVRGVNVGGEPLMRRTLRFPKCFVFFFFWFSVSLGDCNIW